MTDAPAPTGDGSALLLPRASPHLALPAGAAGPVCGGALCGRMGLRVLSRAHVLAGVHPDLPPGSSVLLGSPCGALELSAQEDKHAVRRGSPTSCGLSSCCLSSGLCRAEVFHSNQAQLTSFLSTERALGTRPSGLPGGLVVRAPAPLQGAPDRPLGTTTPRAVWHRRKSHLQTHHQIFSCVFFNKF